MVATVEGNVPKDVRQKTISSISYRKLVLLMAKFSMLAVLYLYNKNVWLKGTVLVMF